MTLLLAATMMFLLPLGFLASVAAAAGFFCTRLQPLILVAMAWRFGRFCAGLAAGEMFAPMLIPPPLLAFAFAVCASSGCAGGWSTAIGWKRRTGPQRSSAPRDSCLAMEGHLAPADGVG